MVKSVEERLEEMIHIYEMLLENEILLEEQMPGSHAIDMIAIQKSRAMGEMHDLRQQMMQ